MQVPNQDIRIYNELTGNQQPQEPEVLLPAPETPMTPPAATVDTAPATGSSVATSEAIAPPVVPAPPEAPTTPAEANVAPAAGTQTAEASAAVPNNQPPQAAEQAAPTAPAATQPQPTVPAAETAQTQPTAPAAAVEQPAKPQTQTAAVGGYRVQLAAVKSADAAKAAWTKMTKANPDALKGLSLKVVKVDRAEGALYRVQGGPLADRAAADSVCSRLKQAGQACMVVAP